MSADLKQTGQGSEPLAANLGLCLHRRKDFQVGAKQHLERLGGAEILERKPISGPFYIGGVYADRIRTLGNLSQMGQSFQGLCLNSRAPFI